MNQTHYREIEKKANLLYDRYGGGMMTMTQLAQELNLDRKVVRVWVREHGLEGVRVGQRIKYETDQVAKAIVNGRGMV